MLIEKTTNPSEISTMADCEPSIRQRDTISSDLNIKGPRTCPSNIDMRAIIPVYDMNPQSRRTKVFPKALMGFNLGNQNNFTSYVLPENPWELNLHTIFRNIYFEAYSDAFGRAALVGEWVTAQFFVRQATPTGNLDIIVGRVRWLIGASDSPDLHLVYCSDDNEPLYGTLTEISADYPEVAPYCRWKFQNYFRLDQNFRLMVLVYTTGVNFPLPFAINIGSMVDFY